jgi:pantothenate kinase type III
MAALILDAGNTRTKVFRWDGPHQRAVAGPQHPPLLAEVGRWPTPGPREDLSGFLTEIALVCSAPGNGPLVVASVIPRVVDSLRGMDLDLVVVDHQSPLPFTVAVDDPAAVGADRYCNVAAAVAAGLNSALVVDVGTATTFDVLEDGVFLGGLIAPGPEFALQALARHAPRLDPVPFEPAPLEAGENTAAAMTRGGWHFGIGGINWCIDGLLQRHGPLPVMLTGGLGHHLVQSQRRHDPHLTLRGAAHLAGLD